MAIVARSQYYVLNNDRRTYTYNDPQNCREGDPVWIRALVTLPATAVAGDTLLLGQVVQGCRPVAGYTRASAANGSLTMSLGYTGSAAAILSASTNFQATTPLALTAAQIVPITYTPPAATDLILTVGGTVSLASNLEVWLQFVNVNG